MTALKTKLEAPSVRALPGMNVWRFRRDGTRFLSELARDYGDAVRFRMGGQKVLFLNHPDLIKEVLVGRAECYVKGRILQRAKRLLGEGLLTSEGAFHKRQRRLVLPAFHRQRIAGYGQVMSEYADRVATGWTDQQHLNIAREMNRLTLAIVGKTLFNADVENDSDDIGTALNDILEMFGYMLLPFAELIQHLPLPVAKRFQHARTKLDQVIYRIIEQRRAHLDDRGDLLSMLLLAQEECDETGVADADGAKVQHGMSDEQVRDEAMTLFIAGHETTAVWLAWTWYLLARNPDAEAELHREVDAVLNGRRALPSDVGQLSFTEKVLMEVLRVRPPAYALGRLAICEHEIGRYVVPKGTLVLVSQFVMHHDARFFDEPEKFKPERWTDDFKQGLPAFAFFPFGGGGRRCIGESFAWMEAVIVTATLAARWRLRDTTASEIAVSPRITLRPKGEIKMRLEQRL